MSLDLTQEELKKHLHYNPFSGVFTRVSKTKGPAHIGDSAGCKKGGASRYCRISIKSKHYQAHRLAFLYMLGHYPEGQVDHISGDTFDNSWVNLRDVDSVVNNQNKSVSKKNTTGVTGVHYNSAGGKWKAQINVNGARVHLGYFSNMEPAVIERLEAERYFEFHANHGRVANVS